jgi:hypothetical protein
MTFQVCGTVTVVQVESSKLGSAQPDACPEVSGSMAKRHAPERESEDNGMATRGPEVGVDVDVGGRGCTLNRYRSRTKQIHKSFGLVGS